MTDKPPEETIQKVVNILFVLHAQQTTESAVLQGII